MKRKAIDNKESREVSVKASDSAEDCFRVLSIEEAGAVSGGSLIFRGFPGISGRTVPLRKKIRFK